MWFPSEINEGNRTKKEEEKEEEEDEVEEKEEEEDLLECKARDTI